MLYHSKSEIRQAFRNRHIQAFAHDIFPQGHSSTNYERWINSSSSSTGDVKEECYYSSHGNRSTTSTRSNTNIPHTTSKEESYASTSSSSNTTSYTSSTSNGNASTTKIIKEECYSVSYSEGYEPYIIGPRRLLPWFDERFTGRGGEIVELAVVVLVVIVVNQYMQKKAYIYTHTCICIDR